jgi:uncharacterized repeat protein (TIGR01451 family)
MARHFSHLLGLKRAAFLFAVLGGLAIGGAQPAAAQTGQLVGLSKKVCAASDLPANPTPGQIGNCSSSSAGIGETVYYVLTVINTSFDTQDITLNDTLPADFVPIPGAQCAGSSLALSSSPASGSTATVITATGPLPAGQSATCTIPGYFTNDGSRVNTATFSAKGQQTDKTTEGSDSALIFIDPTIPLPGNLSIVKTADKTVESLTDNGGQVTVTYTITVTNTGTGDLFTGGYLEVVDALAALQSSGIAFDYSMGMVNCVTTGNTPLCPTLQNASGSGNTTNQSNGVPLGVWNYNPGEDGLIPAGDGFVITMEVTYEGPAGCIYPGTLNGVQNTAFIRFATGQMAFSDMVQGDNTSTTNLEITDHGIVDDCPTPAPDELTVTKVQKSPASGTIAWGTPVEYRITVSNPIGVGLSGPSGPPGPTVYNIDVTDTLALLPGMPNVDVTTHEILCLPPTGFATTPICDPNFYVPATGNTNTQILNQLSVDYPVAKARIHSLADGESIEIKVVLSFKPLSCVSYVGDGLRQTANFGRIDYEIQTPIKNGFITSQHWGISAPVITDHDKVPDCTLKVEKTGPEEIIFGQPFTYAVNYENYGPDPIDIGTLLDAIAIDIPNYAASLSGTYGYICSINPSAAFPANLIQTVPGPTTFTISHNTNPAQGTRLLQQLAPNLPVTLPGNSVLNCEFAITLNQPAATNPWCMGKGEPHLVNSALMDVSHYFNTNLPVPPQAYATTSASLPLCKHVSVTKTIEPSVVAPGGSATITLGFVNHSDHAIFNATLTDALPAGMIYDGAVNCPLCTAVPSTPATGSGGTITAVFGSIPGNSTGTVTVKVKLTASAPSIVENVVKGTFEQLSGNWYDQTQYDANGNISDSDIIGVFELFPVKITKEIVNMSPGQPPNGPFSFAANCSYTYQGSSQPYTFTFTGTASVTLPNATATFMSSAGVPMMVPAGAVCTFTETGLPSGSVGYGFSAVGYSPAAPNGNAGQITVVAGPNEGLVENCYGTPAVKPLLVQHDVGKECPPVVEKTEIFKTCGPAMRGPGGRPWFANCTVTVATSGQFPTGLTVSDNFNGSTGDIVLNSVSPAGLQWTCDPSPTAAPGPHVCTFTGGTQANPGPNTASFDYTVTFADANEAQGSKNCAIVADHNGGLGEYCTGFEVKDTPSWPDLKIDKVCKDPEQRRYAIGAAATGLAWFSDCEITVNASGPLPGPITVTDTLGSSPNGGAMIQSLTAAGWSCAPMPTGFAPVSGPVTCTLAGPFPSNGPWVISATVLLPLGEAFAKNCVELAALGDPIAESCVGIEVPVEDSRLQIKKVVVNNAPGSVAGLSFQVMVGCSNSLSNLATNNLQDGETKPFWSYIPNTTCTVSEGTMPATDACGPGMVPKWTESYAPSNIVALSPSGTQVTITNTLDCRPVIPQGRLLIRKSLDTSAAPGANVASLTFPVNLNCGGAVQTGTISLSAPWSPVGLSTTTPCTVSENVAALPTAGVCPQGQTASWGVSYIPTNQTATPTVAGPSLVVVNKLTCTQNPQLRKISVQKVVVNNAPGSVAGLMFPITVACVPNTPSIHTPKTVSVVDRQMTTILGAQGDTCTISEGAYPATTACGKGMVPVWSKTITPSTLTVGATNAQVLVTNTLNCKLQLVGGGGVVDAIDLVPNPIAFPLFTLTKTCQPAVPVAGATFAQAICTITVTQTAGAPVHEIVVTETLMSGANGAQIVGLSNGQGGQGWSFPAVPFPANQAFSMQLPGNALTGTPPKSTITAVVQLPNAGAATGGQNCVSMQGFDPEGLEMASAGPFCEPLVNGAATIAPDPTGPALDLTHTSAGPCRDDREKQTYTCLFTLDVTNPSDANFDGPEVISQTYGDIRPQEVSGKGEGWACTPAQQNATCVNGELSLLPGEQTTLETRFLLPAQRNGGQFTTCARLGIPEDDATRVLLAQQAAQAFGLDVGQPDGVMGPRTKAAVAQMQERLNLTVTGEPDNALFSALGLRLDKGVAPQCVTVDLPPMAAPKCRKGEAFVQGAGCQPIRQPEPKAEPRKPVEKTPDPVEKPLQCDPETTVLRNGECKCRREGTVKLTETTCG